MTNAVDLDAYFRRIGYTGSREPTLDTLRGIHLQHALTITFENLDPLLRRPVRLDPKSLQEKMVQGGRGGYCFEQNLLLSHMLRAMGYGVTNLAARVLWNRPVGAETPLTHMLLLIDFQESQWVADVGFGGLTLTSPLRLAVDIEQPTPHETFRLIKIDQGFEMQVLIRQSWKPLYSFDLHPQLLADYEVASWYVSTHPESIFVKELLIARPKADCRYDLRNNQLAIHRMSGSTEKRVIATATELMELLEDSFGISFPVAPDLEDTLTRLMAAVKN